MTAGMGGGGEVWRMDIDCRGGVGSEGERDGFLVNIVAAGTGLEVLEVDFLCC